MEGQAVELFATPLGRRTEPGLARQLAEGLGKWGIAFVQLSDPDYPRVAGAHSAVIVGYFCLEGRILPCAFNKTDADWARRAHFIIHDSEGDWPADKPVDHLGFPGYKAARIESIDKAYFFPHGLRVEAAPAADSRWLVRVSNAGGSPVTVSNAWGMGADSRPLRTEPTEEGFLLQAAPGTALITIEAPYYHEPNGDGRRFMLPLDPERPTSGTELVRTPPTPTRSERLRGFEPRPLP